MNPERRQVMSTGIHGLTGWCGISVIHSCDLTEANGKTCTMDIMMHLPRSVFSERQVDLLSWFLTANGVPNVPSAKAMKNNNKILQKSCGIRTFGYTGAFGHRFHVNSLGDIIAQVRSPLGNSFLIVKHQNVGNGESTCSTTP